MANPKTEPKSTPHPSSDMLDVHWNLGVSSSIPDLCLWGCFVLVGVLLELLCRPAGQFLSPPPDPTPVPAYQGCKNDPRTGGQLYVSVDGVSRMLAPQRTRTISKPINPIFLVLRTSHEWNTGVTRWRVWEEAGGSLSLPSMVSRTEGRYSVPMTQRQRRGFLPSPQKS